MSEDKSESLKYWAERQERYRAMLDAADAMPDGSEKQVAFSECENERAAISDATAWGALPNRQPELTELEQAIIDVGDEISVARAMRLLSQPHQKQWDLWLRAVRLGNADNVPVTEVSELRDVADVVVRLFSLHSTPQVQVYLPSNGREGEKPVNGDVETSADALLTGSADGQLAKAAAWARLHRRCWELRHQEDFNRPRIRQFVRADPECLELLQAIKGDDALQDATYPNDSTITRWINNHQRRLNSAET